MENLKKQLVDLLHSAAMYNDKGYYWARDSTAESEALRLRFRAEIDDLLHRIGAANFPDKLLKELSNPKIVRDDSGIYAEKVEQWFAQNDTK